MMRIRAPCLNCRCIWFSLYSYIFSLVLLKVCVLVYDGNLYIHLLTDIFLCLIFQAVCKDKIFPKIIFFAQGYGASDNPRRAYSYIMATSFSGGRSRSTRREPPTMGKQLVNFITCGCESSAPFFVIYKAGPPSCVNICRLDSM
jgi:hypothetical protein